MLSTNAPVLPGTIFMSVLVKPTKSPVALSCDAQLAEVSFSGLIFPPLTRCTDPVQCEVSSSLSPISIHSWPCSSAQTLPADRNQYWWMWGIHSRRLGSIAELFTCEEIVIIWGLFKNVSECQIAALKNETADNFWKEVQRISLNLICDASSSAGLNWTVT